MTEKATVGVETAAGNIIIQIIPASVHIKQETINAIAKEVRAAVVKMGHKAE